MSCDAWRDRDKPRQGVVARTQDSFIDTSYGRGAGVGRGRGVGGILGVGVTLGVEVGVAVGVDVGVGVGVAVAVGVAVTVGVGVGAHGQLTICSLAGIGMPLCASPPGATMLVLPTADP